ncbi:hypothetical protein GQ55_8G059600 [Panicum hallii var. hallii]|uniref:F-box domain-containing protein n=1 Tax=Panicum hallii var. hallii TaxID=1504633 RepID=A0A2T7CL63_9POAL|nr:hypothetical protein GQ55_8G059600 [Panicum hallii var. hallii]
MPQQHVKVSGRRNRRRAPTVGIDTLPDEVLWRMLSFLPVREAAQTCVLGGRWRHLWRYMPVMRIVSGDGPLTRKDDKDMNRFVSIFMFLRDRGAPLELCELKIENLMYGQFCSWTLYNVVFCHRTLLNPAFAAGYLLSVYLCQWTPQRL